MNVTGFAFVLLFLASVLIGKLLPRNISRFANAATMPVVMVLIFTISMWGGRQLTSLTKASRLLIYSLVYSLLAVALTYAIGELMNIGKHRAGGLRVRGKAPLILVTTLIAGWVTGVLTPSLNLGNAVEVELLVLAAVVGLASSDVINVKSLTVGGKVGALASLSALIGSLITGVIASLTLGIRVNISLAVSLGMGWYTFTGPTVALYAGPFYGLLAFLSNFLREQLTFILVPLIPGNPVALLSIGGATTMDDTLPVYVSILGKDYMLASISSGLILTILVPIMVPLALLI